MTNSNPSDADLELIEALGEHTELIPSVVSDDPLEALFEEAQMLAPSAPKKKRTFEAASKSLQQQASEANERLKRLYTDPEHWRRTRGIALIDRSTGVLIGNFSEYLHDRDRTARKLLREHQPIAVDASEEIDGYLGEVEEGIRLQSWDTETEVIISGCQLDEIGVECPAVSLRVCQRFGGIIRAQLISPTQFASVSGNVLLQLGAGTDIWLACSTDTKVKIRKELP